MATALFVVPRSIPQNERAVTARAPRDVCSRGVARGARGARRVDGDDEGDAMSAARAHPGDDARTGASATRMTPRRAMMSPRSHCKGREGREVRRLRARLFVDDGSESDDDDDFTTTNNSGTMFDAS